MTEPTRRGRWSWRLGSVFGISIRVHVTLFVLLVFLAVVAPISGVGVLQSALQWLLVVGVFACILVHELAHALVARRFGCETREILLLPIGGIAQLERLPERPAQELLVAIVGPLTNVVIAALLGTWIVLAGWPIDAEQPSLAGAIVVPLFWSNVALAVFNLLPAFPMDGGRVLRAALTLRMDRDRATRIAAGLGKVMAALFIVAGLLLGAVMLSLVGLFIWLTASQESALVAMKSVLSRGTVADAMLQTGTVIDAAMPVERAAKQMLADGHRELAVARNGRIVGVVTATDVSHAVPGETVGAAMHSDIPVVAPTLSLDAAVQPLEERGVVLVGDANVIIGMLTTEQLATYAALRE